MWCLGKTQIWKYRHKISIFSLAFSDLKSFIKGSESVYRRSRCYWLPLKGLAEADAMRLVTEDYGLTGTKKELAHFVNQMGRHPLLMQLVSSWMREELGEGVCVTEAENLGLDLFTVEGYHRDTETCVREVVTASLARLSARLGDILKRLSVLRGIFDLGLAQGLTAEVTEADLRYLARLSLLQEFPPEPKEGKRRRFQFLPLIQMFVQQQADSEVLRSARLVKPCGTLL